MPHPFELPLFDGRMPAGTELRISGTSGSPTRAIHLGAEVAVLVAGVVRDVQHPETVDSDGWRSMTRRHVLKAERVYLLDTEEGEGLLELERRRAAELREGEEAAQAPLPGISDDGEDGIRNLDRYAERLDAQSSRLRRLATELEDRAGDVRDRAAAMRAKLAELDLEDDDA